MRMHSSPTSSGLKGWLMMLHPAEQCPHISLHSWEVNELIVNCIPCLMCRGQFRVHEPMHTVHVCVCVCVCVLCMCECAYSASRETLSQKESCMQPRTMVHAPGRYHGTQCGCVSRASRRGTHLANLSSHEGTDCCKSCSEMASESLASPTSDMSLMHLNTTVHDLARTCVQAFALHVNKAN
jgi:hypothetical protein